MFRLLSAAVICLLMADTAAAQEWDEEIKEYIAVDAAVVAIENVTIIDGTGAQAVAGQTVVMRDGIIESINGDIPDDAHQIDGTGKTLIPGIVGLHNHTVYATTARTVHLNFTAPRMYLASGVTTIRTTGTIAPYAELKLRHGVATRQRLGPRMFVTGPYINGPTGPKRAVSNAIVTTPEDARRVVRYWSEEGVDWFKVYAHISEAELAAVIDEAHKHGKKVTGHLCSVPYRTAVALGIDNVEHGLYGNTDHYPDKPKDVCPSDYYSKFAEFDMYGEDVQKTYQTLIDAGVAMTSTHAVNEMYVPNRPPLEQRVLDAMSADVRTEFMRERARRAELNEQLEIDLWPRWLEYEKNFVDAGGLLAAGVDPTGYGGALPGYGDQRNYELLHEAGFNTGEVVQIMSLNGAKILEIDDETGSIEAGKHADLVLIDADLASDPALIRKVEIVFRDGVGFDSAKIIESIEGQVGVK